MLHSLDFDVSMIDHVYVAGGIGSGINMKNAVSIGMFPDIELRNLRISEILRSPELIRSYAPRKRRQRYPSLPTI
jgi:hypothetical protein